MMRRITKMPEIDPPVAGRICWTCDHCSYDQAEPGYSEYTPGSDFSLSCAQNHWSFDAYHDGLADFRAKLMSAEKCGNYELHRSIVYERMKAEGKS